MEYAQLAKAFGAFFAIMNPFVNLPIFLSLTSGFTVPEQRRLAIRMTIYAAIMCAVILVAGRQIIAFFGISIDEFRIAGGLVLASISWSMLNGGPITAHHGTEKERSHMAELKSLAFYPITFPIIVGPGTIATIIIYSGHSENVIQWSEIAAVIAVVLTILLAVLYFAAFFGKVLSDTMRMITSRLMGMILMAIAIDMIVSGLKSVLPGLA